MEKYRRIEKPKQESEIKENEIRITTQGKMRNFISYATTLFREKGATEIVLKAMGRAINKTVTIAEIIKRRIPNLHQITTIDSTDITDVYEPLEEGLDRLEQTRHVSSITIVLSSEPLDASAPGYQPPLPEDQVKEPIVPQKPRGARRPLTRGGRGRGRGRRGGFQPQAGSSSPIPGEGQQKAAQAQVQASLPPQEEGIAPRPSRGGYRGGRGGFRGRGRRGGFNQQQQQQPQNVAVAVPFQQAGGVPYVGVPVQGGQPVGFVPFPPGPRGRGGFRGRGRRGGRGGRGRGGPRGGFRGGPRGGFQNNNNGGGHNGGSPPTAYAASSPAPDAGAQ